MFFGLFKKAVVVWTFRVFGTIRAKANKAFAINNTFEVVVADFAVASISNSSTTFTNNQIRKFGHFFTNILKRKLVVGAILKTFQF